jgi:hypothetical protein
MHLLAFNHTKGDIMLRFSRISALVAALFCTSALAASPTPDGATSRYSSDPGFHFLLPIGLTFGGDTLATAYFTNGDTKSIKAGELLQIGLGALYQFDTMPLALSMTANYHWDSVTASNGDMKFKRYPIEMLAYYSGMERFRVGGGVRMVQSPEITLSINGTSQTYKYDNTTGLVLETGFKLDKSSWLNLRYVSEQYKGNNLLTKNGSHFGLFLLGEF